MRTIRISNEVWNAIAEHGKFGETEDDVLRRQFDIAPASGPDDGTSRARPRYATDRMSAWIEDNTLHVSFASGAKNDWRLPDKNDHSAIRTVRSEAVEWAREQGASKGQQDAVKKALTDAGYFVRRR